MYLINAVWPAIHFVFYKTVFEKNGFNIFGGYKGLFNDNLGKSEILPEIEASIGFTWGILRCNTRMTYPLLENRGGERAPASILHVFQRTCEWVILNSISTGASELSTVSLEFTSV